MDDSTPAFSGLIDNPRLFSTVHVGLVDQDTREVVDALYDEAAEYREDVARAMHKFSTPDYPYNDLMRYFSLPDDRQMEASIMEKVLSARLSAHSVRKQLFAVLDLYMSDDLTVDELDAFKEQIELQYMEGWGAEFELYDIPTGGKDMVCVRLHHSGLCFYTADEFDTAYGQREGGSAPKRTYRTLDGLNAELIKAAENVVGYYHSHKDAGGKLSLNQERLESITGFNLSSNNEIYEALYGMCSEYEGFLLNFEPGEDFEFTSPPGRHEGDNYREFVSELEKLSARYGVVLQVVGGVSHYGEELESVTYDCDESSGDLLPLDIQYKQPEPTAGQRLMG